MLLAAYEHEPTREAIPPGIAALHRALELDPDLPDAHYSLAFAKTNYEYDWAGAEAEFRTGLTLNPNYAIGRMWHSLLLSALNRHNEAIAEELHAYQLDPVSPIVQTNLCRAYVFAQRPEDSVPTCKQALDLDSRFVPAYSWLSRAYMNLNQPEKAFAVEQKAWEVRGDRALMQHRELLHRRGEDRALVLEELESAVLRYQKSSIGAHDIAAMYGALNKLDQAFEYLDKAYYAREAALCVINTNPVWSPLRSDPRFRNILRRMNLAK